MLLSLHGQSKDALAKTQLGAWEYDIVAPYFKCNMTDIMAALGLAQLRRYPELLREEGLLLRDTMKHLRMKMSRFWSTILKQSSPVVTLSCQVNGKTREECNQIIEKMAEKGIATNVHYKPLPLLTAYKDLGFDIQNYPNAYHMFENELHYHFILNCQMKM